MWTWWRNNTPDVHIGNRTWVICSQLFTLLTELPCYKGSWWWYIRMPYSGFWEKCVVPILHFNIQHAWSPKAEVLYVTDCMVKSTINKHFFMKCYSWLFCCVSIGPKYYPQHPPFLNILSVDIPSILMTKTNLNYTKQMVNYNLTFRISVSIQATWK